MHTDEQLLHLWLDIDEATTWTSLTVALTKPLKWTVHINWLILTLLNQQEIAIIAFSH